MEFVLSIAGAIIAGVILLIIEYRTRLFAHHLESRQIVTSRPTGNRLALRAFVDQLILTQQDPTITPQNLEQVRNQLLKELNESINRHLIRILSRQDQIALDKLLDTNPSDAVVDQFFEKKIPDLEAEIASVLVDFRTAYLVRTAQASRKSE